VLVLTRRSGESIIIDDDIKVTVVSVSARSGRPYVTLGITAPAKYKIFREEIYEEIKRENLAASHATAKDLSALYKAWVKEKSLPPDQQG
jgi:carbon storage regulator